MRRLAEVLADYRNGDKIADDDLVRLHQAVHQVATLTNSLGPVFHLAASYAAHVEHSTAQMIAARGIET